MHEFGCLKNQVHGYKYDFLVLLTRRHQRLVSYIINCKGSYLLEEYLDI